MLGPLALESARSRGGAETIYCGSSFFPLYRWVVSVDVRSSCSSTHQRALHILCLSPHSQVAATTAPLRCTSGPMVNWQSDCPRHSLTCSSGPLSQECVPCVRCKCPSEGAYFQCVSEESTNQFCTVYLFIYFACLA